MGRGRRTRRSLPRELVRVSARLREVHALVGGWRRCRSSCQIVGQFFSKHGLVPGRKDGLSREKPSGREADSVVQCRSIGQLRVVSHRQRSTQPYRVVCKAPYALLLPVDPLEVGRLMRTSSNVPRFWGAGGEVRGYFGSQKRGMLAGKSSKRDMPLR